MINTNVPGALNTDATITCLMTIPTRYNNDQSSVEPRLNHDTDVEEDLLHDACSPDSVYTDRNLIGSIPIMTMVSSNIPNIDLCKSRIHKIDLSPITASHSTSPATESSNGQFQQITFYVGNVSR